MSQVQASAVKADAEMDLFPVELRAEASFQMTPQAFITILNNVAVAGGQVDLDLTAIGGGITAHIEGVGWNAGADVLATAIALAAELNPTMVAQGGTAVASDDTVILTTNPATDWGLVPTIGSDAPTGFLLNDSWGSLLENFHQFWDSELNSGDNVAMNATDYLHLYLQFAINNASPVTQVQLRLRYGMGEAARGHGRMYDEVGLDVGLAAAGVLPVDTPIVEYQFTVAAPGAGTRHYHKRLSIPVNDPMVKVLVTTDNQPDADDTLEVRYMRTMRDSVTGP
jgi:hypothetical protein